MGKPKLKSSIKALFSFGQPGSKTWVCIQQTKTHSFREVYKSFNSMYYSSSSAASSSTGPCCHNDDSERPEAAACGLSASSSLPSAAEESFSACSSSSSCLSTEPDEIHPATDDDSILRSYISSKRFFFSPCTTKSIMGEETTAAEAEDDLGLVEIAISGNRWIETGDNREENEAEEEEEEKEEGKGECMILEMGFGKESVTMALASLDPYMDFRVSMAEMVEAHGLREWSCLQKLLHCYLRLNDKRTHKIIVLAFVDLLMSLIAGETNADHDSSSGSSSFNKEKRLPLPLRNLLKDETSIITTTTNNNNKNSSSTHKEGCFPLPLCLDV